jgi:aminocarboxymuconate-semialdehyde decarboxylase
MDAAEVDMQVVSNTPQTFLYNQPAEVTAATARLQNDQIVKADRRRIPAASPASRPCRCRRRSLPPTSLPARCAPACAAPISARTSTAEPGRPSLEPVWAKAAELGAFILIHPVGVAGADRLKSYYLANLIGNPVDTTIAAASLVFGGVMERHPNLKICLSHGGGFVPYQGGRWVHGWNVRGEPQANLKVSPAASLRRFYYDTILHAAAPLEYLVRAAGADHVLLGQRLPVRHGHARMRPAGPGAGDRGDGPRDDPGAGGSRPAGWW